MKAQVLTKDLSKKMQVISKVAKASDTQPVFENVKLATKDDKILLTATDGIYMALHVWVAANIEEEGEVLVRAKDLDTFIKNIEDESLQLEVTDDALQVTSEGNVNASFVTTPNYMWPQVPFPTFKGEKMGKGFATGIKYATIATDKEEGHSSSVLLKAENGKTIMVATDRYRLSHITLKDTSLSRDVEAIIPAHGLSLLARLISTEEVDVTMPTLDSIAFASGDYILHLQLMPGNYYEYWRIIPSEFVTEATLDSKKLETAAKRSVVMNEVGSYEIVLGALEVTSTGSTKGTSEEEVQLSSQLGDNLKLMLNTPQLLQFLNLVGGQIEMKVGEVRVGKAIKPIAMFVPKNGAAVDFFHLVAPMEQRG